MRMRIFCAWCGAFVREKAGPAVDAHDGICPACLSEQSPRTADGKLEPVEILLVGEHLLAFLLAFSITAAVWP